MSKAIPLVGRIVAKVFCVHFELLLLILVLRHTLIASQVVHQTGLLLLEFDVRWALDLLLGLFDQLKFDVTSRLLILKMLVLSDSILSWTLIFCKMFLILDLFELLAD